jgi:hypothetical protein
VSEQRGLTLLDSGQPCPSLGRASSQSLELVHGPSDEVLVDASCEEGQPGAVNITGQAVNCTGGQIMW